MMIKKEQGSWLEGIHKSLAEGNSISRIHQEEIAAFNKLGAVDKETARAGIFGKPMANARAIADFPLHEAHVVNMLYPEIFLDGTGKSMQKFLKTNFGKRYAV